MEIVVVSDTNIFIDLFKLGLLNAFFNLPWEIHTTDFVINELEDPDQKASAETYINQNRLIVGTLSAEDLNAILLRRDASRTDAEALNNLKSINPRLPIDEIEERLKKWELN